MEPEETLEYCPICYKLLPVVEIENHVSKCIFLNSTNLQCDTQKRKRSVSPTRNRNECSIQKTNNDLNINSECSNTSDFNVLSLAVPLSQQVQPKTLNEFVGQEKVVGRNTFLRCLLQNNEIPSMILWGPPGCGKTSLANVISEICKQNPRKYLYLAVSAMNRSIKAIHDVISQAKTKICGQKTVLFIDKIHKLNKKQQNMLLVEIVKGDLILVAATTENPSFLMNNSFLFHCKVIVMEKLEVSHLMIIIEKALSALDVKIIDDKNTIQNLFQNNSNRVCIRHSAVRWLAETTDGDARIALNNLQLVVQLNKDKKVLSIANIKDEIQKFHVVYDQNGEEHHNIISAMHESIKGYNDNAALYWTARMIAGGEDPLFVARRLVRAASEDTGNADPGALKLALSIMHGCQLVEMHSTHVLLAQCAIYLARAPTTEETKSALALAKQVIGVCKEQQPDVPLHLRNLPVKLIRELGYEESSKSFMPSELENVKFL